MLMEASVEEMFIAAGDLTPLACVPDRLCTSEANIGLGLCGSGKFHTLKGLQAMGKDTIKSCSWSAVSMALSMEYTSI